MASLEGLRVLVVEDEGPVAMLIEDMLDELGCRVVASAATLPEALEALAKETFDLALLDVNLAGQRVDPVAEALAQRAVPFVFASGYGFSGVRGDLRRRPVLQKPFRIEDLADAMTRALDGPDQAVANRA